MRSAKEEDRFCARKDSRLRYLLVVSKECQELDMLSNTTFNGAACVTCLFDD
jgi:hypothetical protein